MRRRHDAGHPPGASRHRHDRGGPTERPRYGWDAGGCPPAPAVGRVGWGGGEEGTVTKPTRVSPPQVEHGDGAEAGAARCRSGDGGRGRGGGGISPPSPPPPQKLNPLSVAAPRVLVCPPPRVVVASPLSDFGVQLDHTPPKEPWPTGVPQFPHWHRAGGGHGGGFSAV